MLNFPNSVTVFVSRFFTGQQLSLCRPVLCEPLGTIFKADSRSIGTRLSTNIHPSEPCSRGQIFASFGIGTQYFLSGLWRIFEADPRIINTRFSTMMNVRPSGLKCFCVVLLNDLILGVCVLLCFMNPIFENRYGPGVSSCQQTLNNNLGWPDPCPPP